MSSLERLPPEYMNSPMVFIDDWKNVAAVLMVLEKDMMAVLARQIALRQWYHSFMRNKILEVEKALMETPRV